MAQRGMTPLQQGLGMIPRSDGTAFRAGGEGSDSRSQTPGTLKVGLVALHASLFCAFPEATCACLAEKSGARLIERQVEA
ncbi:hypothetical protein N7494_004055 [Penicillium frequentans]|uniref:Uncharacterized protein n=1 Tax=Penicillium frequentans TaxID=3151616 RepID=A0AAD6CZV3_9EURO|nr:hypothetical protein N7494_004055 [Penicillium glabrum]